MKITVKSIEEGPFDDVRFYLEANVNGRLVQSRGTVLTMPGLTELSTRPECRQQIRRDVEYAQMVIDNMLAEGMDVKEAGAALERIILEEIPQREAERKELENLFED